MGLSSSERSVTVISLFCSLQRTRKDNLVTARVNEEFHNVTEVNLTTKGNKNPIKLKRQKFITKQTGHPPLSWPLLENL